MMKKMVMPSLRTYTSEAGSIFFYILLGVILFATLSYVMTRSMRGTSVDLMTQRQAELAAADLIGYGQKISLAVDRVRRKGCSENDISFDHTSWGHTEYVHSPVVEDKCKIFHPNGGGVSFEEINKPHERVIDNLNRVIFAGQSEINNIGQTCGDSSCVELYMFVRMIHASVLCSEINDTLGITPKLSVIGGIYGTPRFDGVFDYGNTLNDAAFDGEIAGCYEDSSETFTDGSPYYDFYYVLLER